MNAKVVYFLSIIMCIYSTIFLALYITKHKRISNLKDKKLRALTAELRINEAEAQTQQCLLDDFKTRLNFTETSLMKLKEHKSREFGGLNKEKEHFNQTKSPNDTESCFLDLTYFSIMHEELPQIEVQSDVIKAL